MSFLSAVKGELGTESNPLSTTADISNNEFNGFQTLFVDFGGQLDNPIQMELLFGESGGPYYVVSWNLTDQLIDIDDNDGGGGHSGSLGISNINETGAVMSYSSDNGFDKSSGSFDVGLNGNTFYRDYFDDNYRVNQFDGLIGNDNSIDVLHRYDIDYYNHATNNFISTTEENALRNHVNILSDDTPYVSISSDSDGGGTGTISMGGGFIRPDHHYSALKSGGNSINMNPAVDDSSDRASIFAWSSGSNSRDSSGGFTGSLPSTSFGLNDVSSDLIIPDEYGMYIGTGGGVALGIPYSTVLNIGDNIRGNRAFVLVRD